MKSIKIKPRSEQEAAIFIQEVAIFLGEGDREEHT